MDLALCRQQQLCHAGVLPTHLSPVQAAVTHSGSRPHSHRQPGQHGKEVPVTGAPWSRSPCWSEQMSIVMRALQFAALPSRVSALAGAGLCGGAPGAGQGGTQ